MPADHAAPKRLKVINTLLALAILALLGEVAWQAMRISALTAQLAQSQREIETRVASLAADKLEFRREEMAAVVRWLDEFYRAKEGLQRPGGLIDADGRPDGEAIGVWILDVYLKARIEGASEEDARERVIDSIKGTDEWRQKHGM